MPGDRCDEMDGRTTRRKGLPLSNHIHSGPVSSVKAAGKARRLSVAAPASWIAVQKVGVWERHVRNPSA